MVQLMLNQPFTVFLPILKTKLESTLRPVNMASLEGPQRAMETYLKQQNCNFSMNLIRNVLNLRIGKQCTIPGQSVKVWRVHWKIVGLWPAVVTVAVRVGPHLISH